ncbi:MAG TPA: AI-2E family transporter [Pirellulales bacterium]|nr:AI-2E family transporter [Pirellulales bacterium]
MSRVVSFVVLVAILLVIAAAFFRVMSSFLLPLFLAVLLVVMFRPVHRWIAGRCRGRERLAAGLTTLAILAIVLLPMLGILVQAAFEAGAMARDWNSASIKRKCTSLREKLGLELPPTAVDDELEQIDEQLRTLAAGGRASRPDIIGQLDQRASLLRPLILSDERGRSWETSPAWIECGDLAQVEKHARELHDAVAALDPEETDEAKLVAGVAAARMGLERLSGDLLGGPVRSWFKRQANPTEEQLATLRERARGFADSMALGGAKYAGDVLPDLLVGLGVMILALYYFLADGHSMLKTLMRLSPLDDRYEEQLLTEFATVSRAVVVATLLSALVQGLLAGAGYFFAGLGSVALLTMLTMLFALIPFIGATAIWLPCCLWLFLEGRTTAAIALAVYGAVVVSMADNLIKPLVLQGQSNLHPLLALLSVLGGVKAMGPIGIVVGPMIVAFLQALLKMLQLELDAMGGQAKDRAK